MIRNKPLDVSVCETAEFDVASYPVSDAFLSLAEKSFRLNISDKYRDVSDGVLRYRNFGAWIVTFLVTESQAKIHLSIIRISMPEDVPASLNVLERLRDIAKLYSLPLQGIEIAIKGKR